MLAKHAAQGTDGELKAAEACSEAILKEHRAFAQKSADEMQQLKPGSKAWWSKSSKLLELKPRCTSIPALKTDDGTWEFRAEVEAEAARIVEEAEAMKGIDYSEPSSCYMRLNPPSDPPSDTEFEALFG